MLQLFFFSFNSVIHSLQSNGSEIVRTCSRPAEGRTIPLDAIAERTNLSVEDVERLLMKSLSVSLSLLVNLCRLIC